MYWEVGLTKRPTQYFIDPQSWNTYSYTRNNPINLVDPTGEVWDTVWDVANMVYDGTKIAKNGLEMAYEGTRNVVGVITGNQQLVQDSQQAWQQDKKELGEGIVDLATDTAFAAVPFVPAGGSKIARNTGKIANSVTGIKLKESGFTVSQHVIDNANSKVGRNIPGMVIDNIIQTGQKITQGVKAGTIEFRSSGYNINNANLDIRVVVNPNTRNVITIIPTSKPSKVPTIISPKR